MRKSTKQTAQQVYLTHAQLCDQLERYSQLAQSYGRYCAMRDFGVGVIDRARLDTLCAMTAEQLDQLRTNLLLHSHLTTDDALLNLSVEEGG